ncbi:hypothetical protein [Kalamiella sp. sgz302252]|uniref:hypothetical protein n=1 Tax=Pantoea sp. sgz302252 TaxID=3341827 RepID=UPI0036D38AA0
MLSGKALRLLLPGIALLLLSGCQSGQGTQPKENNSQAIIFGSCGFTVADSPATAPPEVYRLMTHCIQSGDLNSAAYLFALAGSRTTYDARRTGTQYALSMHNKILKDTLKQLDGAQKNKFWQLVQQNMADSSKKNYLCGRLKALEQPSYAPNYMRVDPALPLPIKESDRADWQKAVSQYNQCS